VLLVNRGLMWFQRRELDRATADLREAVEINPNGFQAFTALAKVEEERNNPEKAIECWKQAIKARPGWAPLYRGRADVLLKSKELTPAQRALALGDLEQAIKSVAPDDSVVARDHTNRARLLHHEGRDRDALDACAAAVKIAPNYEPAHLVRLQILLDLKRHDDVLRSCEALLAQGRRSADVYALRAVARARLKDYDGAIQDDTMALDLQPHQAPILARRGWLYLISGAPKLALRDFEEALSLDPRDGGPRLGRGSARVGLGDYRGAVSDAEAALELGPPGALLSYRAARLYAQAAAAVTSDVRRLWRDAVVLSEKYLNRAVVLATEAVDLTDPLERAAFWRDTIQTDPALKSIYRRVKPPTGSPTGGK
jgi:tetratricopeptide (TPR) repeat protein